MTTDLHRTLLLIAHGSRRESSNQEVQILTEQLRGKLSSEFMQIDYAFLELATPSIPDAIEYAIKQGSREVLLLPYFLAAGRHVLEDIPAILADARQAHPQVALTLLKHLGQADGLIDVLTEMARSPSSTDAEESAI